MNEAIGNCSARYVALLDNDTCIDTGWLTELVAHWEKDPSVGIAGSKVYGHRPARKLNSAVGLLNPKNGYVQVLGLEQIDRGQYNAPRLLDWVGGCSIVAGKELTAKLGYLDGGYKL
jgi:GT2 family glycosyltransferase